MKTQTVREQLLEHTLVLIRRRGVNGFSYRDLAELVGVKTSSIHYYFPSKDDLVLEAVKEYSARVLERMKAVDALESPQEQARGYLDALRTAACGSDQICLAGMLANEALSLSDDAQSVIREFFRTQELRLAKMLERAQQQYGKVLPVPPLALAQVIYAALQSAVVSNRLFGSPERLEAAGKLLVAYASPDPVEVVRTEAATAS